MYSIFSQVHIPSIIFNNFLNQTGFFQPFFLYAIYLSLLKYVCLHLSFTGIIQTADSLSQPSLDIEGDNESGERLEAISFYVKDIKLTIGAEGEFYGHIYQSYGYDYNGDYLSNGIEYKTYKRTKDKMFKFGVCWIQPYTEENDVQTWYGADSTMMP